MSTEAVLFKFIQLGLGTTKDFEVSDAIQWDKLIEMALGQGVVAITFEGYQRLGLQGVLSKMEIMRWYGYANLVRSKWKAQIKSSTELAGLWKDSGIRTLVLKGFAFASYYPTPNNRPASDLDCYLCGRYDDGDHIVENFGIQVNRNDYRHSTFQYKSVHVENHKICTTVRGNKQRKVFERYLRKLLENEPSNKLFGSDLEQPCLMFNALYFLQHSHRHFLREGFQLRYICDWAMIVKAISNSVDFNATEFWEQCSLNDLRTFTESMSRLAYYVCGIRAPWTESKMSLLKQDKMILDDCLSLSKNAIKYGNSLKTHMQMVKNIVNSRWKYKYFSNDSYIKDILVSTWCVFFEKSPLV